MDEKQLLTKLRAGEAAAVRAWYKLYATRLEHFILGKVSNPLDAQEIMQEVFMKSLQNLAHFTGKSTLWTWMCSIAKHEVADYWRKKYAKKTLALVPLMDNLLAAEIGDAHDLAEKIGLILKKMEKGNGELLLQKYVDCKKVAQIAREMGKSSKAVESDLWRARRAFKKAYLELE
jgi:RNA polymerase sigma-70 factor (ECF subfamily)